MRNSNVGENVVVGELFVHLLAHLIYVCLWLTEKFHVLDPLQHYQRMYMIRVVKIAE